MPITELHKLLCAHLQLLVSAQSRAGNSDRSLAAVQVGELDLLDQGGTSGALRSWPRELQQREIV